jgi:hypothetical protein
MQIIFKKVLTNHIEQVYDGRDEIVKIRTINYINILTFVNTAMRSNQMKTLPNNQEVRF